MTPLPSNPNVVLLINDQDEIVGVSTNVSCELKVSVTRSQRLFDEMSSGEPFHTGTNEADTMTATS